MAAAGGHAVEEAKLNGGSLGDGGSGVKKNLLEANSSISLDMKGEDVGMLAGFVI